MEKTERVSVYIDGFNFYFGLKKSFPDLKWVNFWALSEDLLKPHQSLVEVKYFTALVKDNPSKEKRQRDYISAITTTPTKIIYGNFESNPTACVRCGHQWIKNEEKKTDVNIAVHLLTDAMQDKYDAAILISGDSDLVPPIVSVHKFFPGKRVIVIFPPNRHNRSVKLVARGCFNLGKPAIKRSQFPDEVVTKSGYKITKPQEWR